MKNKVLMFPDWRLDNPYQNLLAKGLKTNGFDSRFLSFKQDKLLTINASLKGSEKPDIIHIHWINKYIESIFWGANYFTLAIKFLFIFIDLALLRLKGIKLVWTVHNLFSHESENKTRELIARKIFARLCHVVVHSDGARKAVASLYNISESKISVVPHGNYIGCYENNSKITNSLKEKFDIKSNDMVFLFLGHIRRYKGVEQLVNAFSVIKNPRCKLLIAGKVRDDEDAEWLRLQAKNDSRIKLSLGFIPDDEICSYLSISSVVALPYVNTLTSGSAILAMSFGKPLILPEQAKIFGLPDDGVIYYSKDGGVISALKKASYKDLLSMGKYNFNFSQSLNWGFVTEILVNNVYLK